MSDKDKLKPLPDLKTDEEAERFLDEADLTKYDLSEFKPVRFEFDKKSARVNMRLPEPLLDAVKARAKARGIPYQRFIREALEQALGNHHS
jgi:predicted DNA binding CopG/RHH family protein